MSKKMKFLIGILALALIVSVGFNLVNNFVNAPQTQKVINVMREEALKGWLGKMELVESVLREAKTNDNVKQAYEYVRGDVHYFAEILSAGSSEPMYWGISTATYWLGEGLIDMYFGKSVGAVWTRNLNQTELSLIANVTDNLDGVLSRSALPRAQRLVYMLDYYSNMTGMDPAQELQKVGANVTAVQEHLNQIIQISWYIVHALYY